MSGVQWWSTDPRTQEEVMYSPEDSEKIEEAFQRKRQKCELRLEYGKFTVDFSTMMQFNAAGGGRRVRRDDPQPDTSAPPAAVDLDRCRRVLQICATMDSQVATLSAHPQQPLPALDAALAPGELDMLVDFATDIIKSFSNPRYQRLYGCHGAPDLDLLRLPPDHPVPAYFANVQSGSIYQRKALSMLGLRNLLRRGGEIFREMRAALFSGREEDYTAGAGPAKMRHYTGNVVDLDTVLVRCTDKAAWASAAFGGPFRSPQELSASAEVREYVLRAAAERIAAFREAFGLTDKDLKRRRLAPVGPDIPLATSNRERAHAAVWHYVNVGQDTFHVNVPEMADVYGALLRAPFRMVWAYAYVQIEYAGRGEELTKKIDSFYEDCIADSCFNLKWKSIELYCSALESERSIFDVLCALQAANQRLFAAAAMTDDEEAAAMRGLVAGPPVVTGRDKTGKVRDITEEDIRAWMRINETGIKFDI